MARVPWFEQAWGQDGLARAAPARSGSRPSTSCGRTSCSSPSGMPRPPRRACGAPSSTSSWTTPECCWPCAGTVALCLVVVTSVRKARRAAALRVVAPHPPLRLPRCRAGAAAPAVDRPGVPGLAVRDGLLVGPVCRVLPGPCSSSGWACRCGARCARRSRRTPCGPRGQASRRVTVAGPGVRGPPRGGGPVLHSGASSTGPAGAGGTPTPSPRHPTARPCASLPRTSATGSARLADAEARDARPRRGALRPDAPGRAHAPQGPAHGSRHRHRAACAPCSRGSTRTRATSPSSTGRAHGTGSCSPMRSAHWPHSAAPVTSSSRGRAYRAATAGCRPRRRTSATREALLELVPDVAHHDVFLCGAPPWMEAARQAALDCGVPPEHIHLERFAY